jgi:hypothetical protein
MIMIVIMIMIMITRGSVTQVASIYAKRLGLKAMVVPFRNSVDHFSVSVIHRPTHQFPSTPHRPFRRAAEKETVATTQEYVITLSMLGTTIGSMAREVRELQKNEFGELSEPSHKGGVGSSTMPQKVNPKLCMGCGGRGASFLAAVLTEMYLCNVCSCEELLRRNGRGGQGRGA